MVRVHNGPPSKDTSPDGLRHNSEPGDREALLNLLQRLLDSGKTSPNLSTNIRLSDYIDLWQSDLKLRGTSKLTYTSYRQKVEDLLEYNDSPDELAVKAYPAKKQESGKCSGTIANYVKAFEAFSAISSIANSTG